jgi:hypothetical protein
MVTPRCSMTKWPTIRSKMCDSGRNERHSSAGEMCRTDRLATTFDVMLPCVSITPLGSPVVPEV